MVHRREGERKQSYHLPRGSEQTAAQQCCGSVSQCALSMCLALEQGSQAVAARHSREGQGDRSEGGGALHGFGVGSNEVQREVSVCVCEEAQADPQ